MNRSSSFHRLIPTTLLDSALAGRSYRIARLVSNIGCPPVIGLLAVVVSVYASPIAHQARWGLLFAVVSVLIPVIYVLWLVRRGRVADFHLSARHERIGPFVVTLGSSVAGWLLMRQPGVSPTLQVVAALNVVQTAILLLITLQWKISIHSTAVTGLAVLAFHYASSLTLFFLLCIPLIGWSRVRLQRHTVSQVLAGTALGAVLVYITVWLHQVYT